MVNYCCVYGCGRNSRFHKHLNFYGVPKDKHRQEQWLKAVGREELLKVDPSKIPKYRVCSRHFDPSNIKKKNRALFSDAVPTLSLPGSSDCSKVEDEPQTHPGILCNSCTNPIEGFRYTCVSCEDFDLCKDCEMSELHRQHFMLRIPKPVKFKLADNLKQKWKELFKTEHVQVTDDNSDDSNTQDDSTSSDDEPITKYAKNYDSGIDLSEDVKYKIRKEVMRALKVERSDKSNKTKVVEKKRMAEDMNRPSKRLKFEENSLGKQNDKEQTEMAPEVAFADVNEIKDNQGLDMKTEFPMIVPNSMISLTPSSEDRRVMHVKLSEDLSELMIEVTSNNDKTVYKYTDGEQA